MIQRSFLHALSLLTIGMTTLLLSGCDQQSADRQSGHRDSGTSFVEAQHQRSAQLPVIFVPAPGFAYYNEEGELTGVAVEIMRDFKQWFERYHGISVEFDFIADENWSNMYQRVSHADGGVFGLGNVTITAERRNELQFSPPYLFNVAVLITPDTGEPMDEQAMFADYAQNLEPLAFVGTLHETRINALRDSYQPGRDIVHVTSNQAVIDGVAEGHYSYVDAYNYYRAREQGTAIMHHPVFNLEGEQFGVIMPHSNDWHVLMTAFFAADGGYVNTPRYAELLREHLGDGVANILLESLPG